METKTYNIGEALLAAKAACLAVIHTCASSQPARRASWWHRQLAKQLLPSGGSSGGLLATLELEGQDAMGCWARVAASTQRSAARGSDACAELATACAGAAHGSADAAAAKRELQLFSGRDNLTGC